jgi:hypothetical protein
MKPMTFEQLFSGRMLLMRVQRHISQVEWDGRCSPSTRLNPHFKTPAGEEAFFIVERLLVLLEGEFDEKKKRCNRIKQRRLDQRADRQVRA